MNRSLSSTCATMLLTELQIGICRYIEYERPNYVEFKKEEKCNEECIVCEAPLVYLEKDELMECVLCHKKEFSKTRCQNGHYVCNDCHTKGMDVIISMCLKESSQNPIEIIRTMMNASFCHMHGPEHHVMVGVALLTAYKNAGGNIELKDALIEMMHRGKAVPGGACGFW